MKKLTKEFIVLIATIISFYGVIFLIVGLPTSILSFLYLNLLLIENPRNLITAFIFVASISFFFLGITKKWRNKEEDQRK